MYSPTVPKHKVVPQSVVVRYLLTKVGHVQDKLVMVAPGETRLDENDPLIIVRDNLSRK